MIQRNKTHIFYLLLILTYTGLYFTTGMIIFNYEGTWDESTGELWTFQSMTPIEMIAYIIWYIANFPLGLIITKGIINLVSVCLINPILVGWTVQKLFTRHKDSIMSIWTKINIGLTVLIIIGWAFFVMKDL